VSQWVYVIAGWGISAVAIVGYAAAVIVRGRALSRRVPPDRRRWMSDS
jgi:hypothetical protein